MRTIALPLVVSLLGVVLPVFAQSPKDAGKEIRITGCVQWEKQNVSKDDEFVLTMVKPDGGRKATVYRITGDRAKELERRVGQQLDVIGVVEDESKAASDRAD